MTIRHTRIDELEQVMEIYDYARHQMRLNGNPSQWIDGYPTKDIIKDDINNDNSFIIEDNDEILGVFTFIIGIEPTYENIIGEWINDETYGTIHRIASAGKGNKVFNYCLDYCFKCVANIRIDTHEDNKIMRHILESNGFYRCGTIFVSNGTPRIAYQKKV